MGGGEKYLCDSHREGPKVHLLGEMSEEEEVEVVIIHLNRRLRGEGGGGRVVPYLPAVSFQNVK